MPIPAEARFWITRLVGLWRRGLASLRNRGIAASWQRTKMQFRRGRVARHALYAPGASPFAPFTMPTTDAPRVSLVIPIHGAFAHTLACLRAIAAHR
nr:glycosyl transferase [Pseudomonadota bacterium]